MANEEEMLVFTTEDGEETAFYILEQTKLNGMNYLLVADSADDEANALILRERPGEAAKEAVYDVVEEETELEAVADVFGEILEDIDIEKE